MAEELEFTVYGANNFMDAFATIQTAGVIGNRSFESGKIHTKGVGSTFESGVLKLVVEDG